jgi:putative membrane protein
MPATTRRLTNLLILAAAAAILSAPAIGVHAAPLSDKPGTALAGDGDVMFLRKAAMAGTMEIDASNLAQSRASSGQVKAFAAQMIQDHRAAEAKLQQQAQRLGVQLPATPLQKDQQALAKLGQLKGAEFDRAYAQQVGVDAHQDAVALFRKAADDAKDDGVKSFARETLPTLEHHLEMAQKMASQLKP